MMKSPKEYFSATVFWTIVVRLSLSNVRYGDNAGNTVEENSSVFSLIRMR